MRTRSAWGRGNGGQAAVMVALMLGILVIFVAFSINAGLIVNDRIRIQNASDLIAYAGAARQAQALNEMKEINDDLVKGSKDLREKLVQNSYLSGPYQCDGRICPCPSVNQQAEQEITQWRNRAQQLNQQLDQKNEQGNQQAETAMKSTADANYEGVSSKLKVISHESDDVVMEIKRVEIEFRYATWCQDPLTGAPRPNGEDITQNKFETWAFKDFSGSYKDTVTIVELDKVKPTHGLVDFPAALFEPQDCPDGGSPDNNGNCTMSAYAAARPFRGKLGTIEAGDPQRDNQKMQEVHNTKANNSNCQGGPCIASDVPLRDIENWQNNDFREYKVRPVGVFEGEEKLKPQTTNWSQEINCGSVGNCIQYFKH